MALNRSALWLLPILIVQLVCHADVKHLLVQHRRVLEDFARFRPVRTAKELPPLLVAHCADRNGRLADPGKAWLATDVITDDRLPRKRLIWAATDGDYFVLHYERGGLGHSFHILVARLPKGSPMPTYLWRSFSDEPLKDYGAFLDALKAKRLDDAFSRFH